MDHSPLVKAGLLAAVLALLSVTAWELYWRHQGFPVSYNDDEALWSDKRAMVYEPAEKSTVFIGSSRIKFDLDIPTWEKETGNHAIQLAMVGSTPRPALEDLANDQNFRGKLVVDVTEGLFFQPKGNPREKTPNDNITYYKKRTPTQRASFLVNHLLESRFVFLQQNTFSFNALLDNMELPQRKGVYGGPHFPPKFSYVSFDRQTSMSPEFVTDTAMQAQVKQIWMQGALRGRPAGYDTIQQVFREVKACTDRIRSRCGQVLFVRTPSSGVILEAENKFYPRDKYWDALLSYTGCPGIHFADHPAMAHFICPEWSHLKPADGIVFTRAFIDALNQKGWFSNKLALSTH
jgi:hypothetical protein